MRKDNMKTLREETIELIQNDLQNLENNPAPYWKESEMEYQSYTKSALNDILTLLNTDSSVLPLDAVMEYRKKMDDFACLSKSPDSSFIFSLAYDVAEYVIDEMIKIENGKGNKK